MVWCIMVDIDGLWIGYKERKYQRERKREKLWPPILPPTLPRIVDDEFLAWCPSQLIIICVFSDFKVLK